MRHDQTARDLASLASENSLFVNAAREKLGLLLKALRPLAARYDVVVANPPYMSGANMNRWVAEWVKKAYPNSKRDICTCFIERGGSLVEEQGYIGMITASSWMFISSFEDFRRKLLSSCSICSMIQQSTHGYAGVTVPTTMFVLADGQMGIIGSYIRLEDFDRPQLQEAKALEALANPECGWFYRRDTNVFEAIPGMPIVYWANKGIGNAFKNGTALRDIGEPRVGLQTGENARFVRQWWEVSLGREWFDCPSIEESVTSRKRWFPYNKGGEYRKWYGNNDCVVNWENDGIEIRNFKDDSGKQLSRPQNTQCYFQPSITWSKISSGSIAFRYKPVGHIFDVAGTSIFAKADDLVYLHGACNSSVILQIASMLSPTLNFEVGQIATYPIVFDEERNGKVTDIVDEERVLSKEDWDAIETSWDFGRHPLA